MYNYRAYTQVQSPAIYLKNFIDPEYGWLDFFFFFFFLSL